MTELDEPPRFFDGLGDRLGPQRPAEPRDDAEGAMGITAVLDLQLGPHVGTGMAAGRHNR